jgi:hypothetical protein
MFFFWRLFFFLCFLGCSQPIAFQKRSWKRRGFRVSSLPYGMSSFPSLFASLEEVGGVSRVCFFFTVLRVVLVHKRNKSPCRLRCCVCVRRISVKEKWLARIHTLLCTHSKTYSCILKSTANCPLFRPLFRPSPPPYVSRPRTFVHLVLSLTESLFVHTSIPVYLSLSPFLSLSFFIPKKISVHKWYDG